MQASTEVEISLDKVVCLALYSSMQATLQLYRDLLAPWGLTYQQLMVLALLWQHAELSPGDLARSLMLDSSSVTGLLNRMESAGLVERERHPGDRRAIVVRVTERGNVVRAELGGLEDCIAEALALGPDDAADLVARLHTLRAAVTSFRRPTLGPAAPQGTGTERPPAAHADRQRNQRGTP